MIHLRKKKLKNGNTSLYLDIYYDGQREYKFLDLYLTKNKDANKETLRLAETLRSQEQVDRQNIKKGFAPIHKGKISVAKYFENNIPKGIAVNTKENYNKTLRLLKLSGLSTTYVHAIDRIWGNKFKAFLLDNVSANTAYSYMAFFKKIINKAVEEKLLHTNPLREIRIKRTPVKKEFLEIDELQLLASTPCRMPFVKYAFIFSCYTGLRLSDVKVIKESDIRNNTITIKQIKTGKDIEIPLNETAFNVIALAKQEKKLNISDKIFILPDDRTTNRIIAKWVESAKIGKAITFHNARHYFGTHGTAYSSDIYTMKELLGHVKIENTQVYVRPIDEKKKKAVSSIPGITIKGEK